MAKFIPDWTETAPKPGTLRSIFKYGDHNEFKHPSNKWYEMVKEDFGLTDADFQQKKLEGHEPVVLNKPVNLKAEQIEKFKSIVGAENVNDDDYSRVYFSNGKTTEEMEELRRGVIREVCDLVVHPRNKQDVAEIVKYCNDQKIPVTVWAAGSSVNMGCRPKNGGITLVVSTHMNKIISINEENQTVKVGPGMYGPAFEEALNNAPERFNCKRRYTCGHFPQSFEYSTVGGWAVTLGSGQNSTYFGDAYDLTVAQEYVTPAGNFKTLEYPGTATGPKVNDIMKGNEGAFGVLVEVTWKLHRHMPENNQYYGYMFPTWEDAVNAAREVNQGEFGMPAIFRISDPEETDRGLKLYGMPDFADKFLQKKGFMPMQRCLCLGIAQGEKGFAKNIHKNIKKIVKKYGAISLTSYAAKKWELTRFKEPYMREDLGDFGLMIDTLESGVTWDNLHNLHKGVREFMKERPNTMCMTHASHFYPQGTNLYFIFIGKFETVEEYVEFHRGILEKINECGGSLSHHHGVGKMIGYKMEDHLGKEQMDVLRALKNHFDPNNIMNPGQMGLG